MPLEVVSTDKAPAAGVAPLSQAIKVGNLVFVSGQVPLDPTTGKLCSPDVEAQALQSLTNMKAIVEASGSSLNKVAKTLVFLKDMNDFTKVNAVYAKFFGDHRPARSCVEVARLPFDILFEIECIAVVE